VKRKPPKAPPPFYSRVRDILETARATAQIRYALRSESQAEADGPGPANEDTDVQGFQPRIRHALRAATCQPGRLHPGLSWTYYRTLLRALRISLNQRRQGDQCRNPFRTS
jgi:hypothetical protein